MIRIETSFRKKDSKENWEKIPNFSYSNSAKSLRDFLIIENKLW